VAPSLAMPTAATVASLTSGPGLVVFGPRSGAKTVELTLPEGLPPGALRDVLPIRVLSVETLRPDCPGELVWNGQSYASATWREEIEVTAPTTAKVLAHYEDGGPAIIRSGKAIYVSTLTDRRFLTDFLEALCGEAGIATQRLAPDLRLRRRGDLVFAFNYGNAAIDAPAPDTAGFVIGGRSIAPRDVAVWRNPA
jgi:beta-galactosidase